MKPPTRLFVFVALSFVVWTGKSLSPNRAFDKDQRLTVVEEEDKKEGACPLTQQKESCARPNTTADVRHVIMMSGPRHGTSFVMSLLSDSGGTLYLGELLNIKAPLAHANLVNQKNTLAVMRYLNEKLPGAKVTGRSISFSALHINLGQRIAFNAKLARQSIEEFAVIHGFHTLLYKLFANQDFIEQVKRERCTHFVHLQRNFLQVQFSLLEVRNGPGKFVRSTSSDVFNFNISSLATELKRRMNNEMLNRKVAADGNGANLFLQYEELLSIEEAGAAAVPPKEMKDTLRDVKHFIIGGLDKTARDSSTSTATTETDTNHVLCPYRLSEETEGLYTRQDTRATLKSKVGNYEELKKIWWGLCIAVVTELGQDRPDKSCRETTWNLPE